MKRMITILCAVVSLVLLCSCGAEKKLGENDILVKTIENIDSYVIIRQENSSDVVREAAASLQNHFLKLGKKIYLNGDSKAESKYEIIIGETNREIDDFDYSALKLNEYVIKLAGNKIVIAGGSDKATAGGVEFFISTFIPEGQVRVPTREGFSYVDSSVIESISIDGNDFRDYTIVSNLYDTEKANSFALKLFNVTNVYLPVVSVDALGEVEGKYIMLDDTNTDFSKYSVDIKEGNVTLFANYVSIDNCIDYFIGEIIGYDEKTEKLKGESVIKIGEEQSKIFDFEQKPVYTKEKLLEALETVYNDDDSIIIGQQMSELFAPVGGLVEKERAQYVENCKVETPMLGYDLGTLEYYASRRTENGVIKEAYDIIQFMREGGIVTFSMHLDNPGPERALDHYRGELRRNEWDEMFTEGTEINKNLMETLTYIGDFLEIFKINEAPVILRPLHEMNGSWFWFCIVSGDDDVLPQSYAVDFWKMLYEYFVIERGIDNMLWEYSPNVANPTSVSGSTVNPMYCYPGDEYVDLVALDWYTPSKTDVEQTVTNSEQLAQTGKVFSMAEFGPSGDLVTNLAESDEYKFNCNDLHDVITRVRSKGVKIAYWLLWSSWEDTKISMWNMGDGEFFYEDDTYLTLEDTYKLLYE